MKFCTRVAWSLIWLAGGVAWGQPVTLRGPGLESGQYEVTTFADGLNFPVGMTSLDDGSVLAAVSNGSSFFGSSSGSIVRLVDADRDGVAELRETLVADVPGGRLSSLKRAGDLVAVTGQGQNVPISFYRISDSPSELLSPLGQLQFTYPSGGWLHPHSSLLLRESPQTDGDYELYFQLGSDANFQATRRTVGLGGTLGLTATLVGEAIHRVTLQDIGSGLVATSHDVVATGLRNPTGLAFHPLTGDLYVGDNGIDGLVDPNEPTSPDEINVLPATDLGGTPESYGFPSTYQEYRSGVDVGSSGLAPLTNFQPLPSPDGAEAEGINEIAFSPPLFGGSLAGGIFAGFHGIYSGGGLSNEENAVAFVDPETGAYFHVIGNDEPAIGHLDGLHSTRDTLFLADISPGGNLSPTNANSGKIYAIRSLIRPGDYNRDGLIDAADYTVWRDTQGESGLGLAADGDGDFAVGLGDYDVWRDAYNAALVAGANRAPAPGAVTLLLIGAVFAIGLCARVRSKNSSDTRFREFTPPLGGSA
ncbi:hypothetical protein Pla123a_47660 [Posidoniimonas polymericola]|uniref:Glucose/Sorbosone dehydrogenase domain-containing protein n=1 Tax=Posidoniimonas polymericola TaxID=2528002 RepID=A0A5C5XXB2_9BACT|nr:hypothetical protein [Posidoniimonas polymericola]TWT66242.1 hypothetical protein Pla123a_47660 [Posidoniimonas polymericola]